MNKNDNLERIVSEIVERITPQVIKRHIGGTHSQVLPGDTKDATGRRIIDIGRGRDEITNVVQQIIASEKSETKSFTAKFVKDRCYLINKKTIQLQMTPPNSTGFERFIIKRKRNFVDHGQSEGLEAQEVTTGIGNAQTWTASTAVTHDKTIVIPTSPTGKYYRCVTSGTTGTTEPTWTDTGTITDGTAEWELQDTQPVIGDLNLQSAGQASYGASANGLRIIKIGQGGDDDWDYGWGNATPDHESGISLLHSLNGAPWKQFRIGAPGDSSYGITCRIEDIRIDEWVDGGTYYAIPTTVIVSRPLLELPHPLHYTIDIGVAYTYYAPYDVRRYIRQENGDIWTELVLSSDAASRSNQGSYVWSNVGSAPTTLGIGDTIKFAMSNAYGQDDQLAILNDIAPLRTKRGVGAVIEYYSSNPSTYTGDYYACRRYFLYEWRKSDDTATITELKIPDYETDWHGTSVWDNVTCSLEQTVSDGDDYGVLVQLHKTDSTTPEYFRRLYVSENGGKFVKIVDDNGTTDPTERAFGIGFHQDYFNTLTYGRIKHLCLAHGAYSGTTYTVYSVTTREQLYTGTFAGNIASASGVQLALSYAKPDPADTVADSEHISYCNILVGGAGMVYYALTPETFLFGPYNFDFTSDFPESGPSSASCDVPYLNGTEMFLAYQYSTTNELIRSSLKIDESTTIGDYSNSSISYTELAICDNNEFSGHQLAPLLGEPDVCVIEALITGTYFDGTTGQRIFIFRYDPSSTDKEVGRIDGTVFHVYTGKQMLSDGYVLYGVDSDMKAIILDGISVEDIANATELEASSSMGTVPDATDGDLAQFQSGQVVDSGIPATDVMRKTDYDPDDDGKLDADIIEVDPSDFDGILSSTDTDVQTALDTIDDNAVPVTRKVNTSMPITGGGDLSADRTIGLNYATYSLELDIENGLQLKGDSIFSQTVGQFYGIGTAGRSFIDVLAEYVVVSAGKFGGILSSTDTDVQTALGTIDFNGQLVKDTINTDREIPAGYQLAVWEELEIQAGVTLTVNGKLILEG